MTKIHKIQQIYRKVNPRLVFHKLHMYPKDCGHGWGRLQKKAARIAALLAAEKESLEPTGSEAAKFR
jgi:hypothetical protein